MRKKQLNVISECIRGGVSCEGEEVLLLSCAPGETLHNVVYTQLCGTKMQKEGLFRGSSEMRVLQEKVKALGLNSRKWCTGAG